MTSQKSRDSTQPWMTSTWRTNSICLSSVTLQWPWRDLCIGTQLQTRRIGFLLIVWLIITVRKRSNGKVMFLHLSVSHSVHRREGCVYPCVHWGKHLPGQTPPVQCMLGYTPHCPVHAGIHTPLPSACWDTHLTAQCMLGYTPPPPTGGHCCGRYTFYWNAFLYKTSITNLNTIFELPLTVLN